MPADHVTFEADYVERRSRLSTFFRLLLAIPLWIMLVVYGTAAYVVVLVAWFALVITGRYPRGMYDFVAGFLRFSCRANGYMYLLTDAYPPFSGAPDLPYPVRLSIPPAKAKYSRAKAFFRVILAIVPYVIAYAMSVVASVGVLLAWFAIVLLGRQPKGLQDMIVLGLSYQARVGPYFLLLTEDWPPFTDDHQAAAAPPPPPPAPVAVADSGWEPPQAGA